MGFCNQQFYGGELVPMTTREGRPEPFAWIDTTGAPVERKEVGDQPGSKFSPRQTLEAADGVKVLAHDGIALADIGAVSPYRAGAEDLSEKVEGLEAATVHKFQGREKDVILFTAVDNRVTAFNDSANRINVAVSRAKNRFVLISADFAETPDSNLASLVRYILYLDLQARRIAKSKYRSVFDALFV
ncbi:C-terminal helicase domain-containing protein [Duodenibacillus massiliensis]|uniref:C-terminal helicase domain-containing protein n=1 Tax=Duodenibacillus massiliensis TaxID=1852381 RepID=UPI003F7EEEF7